MVSGDTDLGGVGAVYGHRGQRLCIPWSRRRFPGGVFHVVVHLGACDLCVALHDDTSILPWTWRCRLVAADMRVSPWHTSRICLCDKVILYVMHHLQCDAASEGFHDRVVVAELVL
mmetsp:Transcript_36449/g.96994  ORF Transcript_36449/g.96994 Transcript_36449/m.96994 type:complete len:116 (-) Transcript_36449:29-376(-)